MEKKRKLKRRNKETKEKEKNKGKERKKMKDDRKIYFCFIPLLHEKEGSFF